MCFVPSSIVHVTMKKKENRLEARTRKGKKGEIGTVIEIKIEGETGTGKSTVIATTETAIGIEVKEGRGRGLEIEKMMVTTEVVTETGKNLGSY